MKTKPKPKTKAAKAKAKAKTTKGELARLRARRGSMPLMSSEDPGRLAFYDHELADRLAIYLDVSRLYQGEIVALIHLVLDAIEANGTVSQWTTEGERYLGATIDRIVMKEGQIVEMVTEAL